MKVTNRMLEAFSRRLGTKAAPSPNLASITGMAVYESIDRAHSEQQ